MFERYHPDSEAYETLCQTGPCFICQIVARNPEYPAHIIYEDDAAIAFLDKYPTLYGVTLVAPREHREQVTGDLTLEEYLNLQRLVYRIAEAVRQETSAERVYLLSLGSQQGNRHIHWLIFPLPPGVPYKEQQLAAISWKTKGVLRLPEEEKVSLAARLRRRMEHQSGIPKPLIRKIDCIRLSVPDLDAGLAFYRDRLGHQIIWRTGKDVGLRLPESDAEIVLHTEWQEPEIDLKVDSADEAAARFAEAGGRVVVPPFEIQIGRAAVVEDPWGNRLVLLDTSKGLLVTDADGNVVGNAPPAGRE